MKIQDNKFNFFVPAQFEKSGSKDKMKIKGVCSTGDEDFDGEFLDPDGFDFSPLLASGYFNWNHQGSKDPGAIIGRPTMAKVLPKKQFYVEGFLYSGVKAARDIYDLAKSLEEEDPERNIGFSIEGTVVQRDPVNPKKVRKAIITGIALTHCPKNSNTLLSIVKGTYNESFIGETEDNKSLVDGWCNWSNGRDLNRDNVITFLQENFTELDPNDDFVSKLMLDVGKSMSTANIPMQESVEGDPYRKQKKLLKSNVYSQIISKFNFENEKESKIEDIFSFIEETALKLFSMKTITQEVLNKSFSILEESIKLEKGKNDSPLDKTDEVPEEKELEEEEDKKKSKSKEEEVPEEEEPEKEVVEKSKDSFDFSKLATGFSDLLQKSYDENFKVVENLGEQISDRFEAIGDLLQKSYDESSLLRQEIASLQEQVLKVGNTPYPKKSITNLRGVERFEKSQDSQGNQYSLSIPQHRNYIKEQLFEEFQKSMVLGKPNQLIEKSIMDLEIAKSLPTEILPFLSSRGIDVIN